MSNPTQNHDKNRKTDSKNSQEYDLDLDFIQESPVDQPFICEQHSKSWVNKATGEKLELSRKVTGNLSEGVLHTEEEELFLTDALGLRVMPEEVIGYSCTGSVLTHHNARECAMCRQEWGRVRLLALGSPDCFETGNGNCLCPVCTDEQHRRICEISNPLNLAWWLYKIGIGKMLY